MCRNRNGNSEDGGGSGGETIVGRMAMYMEDLHLTFHDVYEVIPYPLLVVMSSDKPRRTSNDGEKVNRITMSGREMMNRK